jgi:histone acetyltransferase 1
MSLAPFKPLKLLFGFSADMERQARIKFKINKVGTNSSFMPKTIF